MLGAAIAADPWEETLAAVAPSVVSLEVTATRDFDTELASTVIGTGFVVDAARGIILTNRHLVYPGPVSATATFIDDEEVALTPLYRDPVHDFGFYRYDPAALHHIQPIGLDLAPDAARVGAEVRVIGSDGGERGAILAGTLARLDRPAPEYGRGRYNDFNTFYLQASTSTSGGSSGSPVVDVTGRVVGLNAGGRLGAASAFYLPLQAAVVALDALRAGSPVARGTWQAVFRHEGYAALGRGLLRASTAARVRAEAPAARGLLVVDTVVPEGPADGVLEPGDVLVAVEGDLVTDFLDLERRLDAAVGDTLRVQLERRGAPMEVDLPVGDLHALAPDAFLEVGRAVLHDVSLQIARAYGIPARGVYVASEGYLLGAAGVPRASLLTHIDGQPIGDLDDAEAALAQVPEGASARVRFALIGDPEHGYDAVIHMNRAWFAARRCTRDDASGAWPCEDLPPAPAIAPGGERAAVELPTPKDPWVRRLGPALVAVRMLVPYPTAGVQGQAFGGAGVVVDAARGIVLTDRRAVPVALGDVTLTFAGTVRVPASVLWLHPVHNLALLQYHPADLAGVEVAEARLGSGGLDVGDRGVLVDLDRSGRARATAASVTGVDAPRAELGRLPRFRPRNSEVATLDAPADTLGGVLVDKRGTVLGLHAGFTDPGTLRTSFGTLPGCFLDVARQAAAGEVPRAPWIGVEVAPLALATARERGLPDDAVSALARHAPERLSVLEVVRVDADAPAAGVLRESDLLLSIDGRVVARPCELEGLRGDPATVRFVRDATVREALLPLARGEDGAVREVVGLAGLLLHDPHPAVSGGGRAGKGLFVAWQWTGSPGARAGFRGGEQIAAVDGLPTPDLAALRRALEARPDPSAPLVLDVIAPDGTRRLRPVVPDPIGWPTEWLDGQGGAWQRVALAASVAP